MSAAPILRHAGSNLSHASDTGNRQFLGNAALAGHGTTRSCDKCLAHNISHFGAYLVMPKLPGQVRPARKWYCAGCTAARVARLAAKELK